MVMADRRTLYPPCPSLFTTRSIGHFRYLNNGRCASETEPHQLVLAPA
jgi:hypothetical protein